MRVRVVLLFVLVYAVLAAVQGEITKDLTQCGRTKCKLPLERKFKYQEGIHYVYTYSVDVNTNLGYRHRTDQARKDAILHIDAALSIYFNSPCEGILKILNATISHDRSTYNAEFPDHAGSEFKANLERFELKFTFDDGLIQELCPDRREPVWSLNLKRGVLSMLQNSMRRFDIDHRTEEVDVYGTCDTEYRLHEVKRTSLIVKKSKKLTECQNGPKYFSVVQSNFYKSPQKQHGQHGLFKSHSNCEITIDHNVYEKVVCEETRLLQPLSNGNKSGARTESRMILQLVQESAEASFFQDFEENEDNKDEDEDNFIGSAPYTKRTTLLYDHAKTLKTMHGELRTSRDLLKSVCRLAANTNELQQRFSEMFTNFVHSARFLDYPSLSQLFVRANSICRNGQKHIIATLPYLNNNAAVNLMKNLIIKKQINQEIINDWVITFALFPRPDRDTIKALSQLLNFQNQIPQAQFILSYSTIVHTYCTNNNVNCIDSEEVDLLLSHLQQKISQGCTARLHTPLVTKETLEALKAIGNMGLETKNLRKELKKCIDDTGGFLPMEVRVAAVDAHRRLKSCEETRDHFFLDYYRNMTLDTEIRIASYLQVMRCPDYSVIKTIKHTLKKEEVNQVGTFVWSHLTNLYNSASPTRVEIQSLLTDEDLDNKFNNDIRKFSRNYENSFFSEEYNIGANYQTNLIFSPKSYVPRSLTFNVTTDLFGQSVNLFEITARMEGLEYYAENIFGPNGSYMIFNEEISSHLRNFLRYFRSAPEEKENYSDGVKQLPNIIDNNFDHPKISLGYKMFGNELKFTMLDGDKEITSALANVNPLQKMKEFLAMQEILYERTGMFLDSSYVVPTGSGLPIRLDLAGSAACNFKISKMLNDARLSAREFQLTANIASSISVDMVGTMTVDAFYKSAGFKLRTNVYSSGNLQLHLNLNNTRLVRISLGLPNRKLEALSLVSDVALIKGNGAEIKEESLEKPNTITTTTTCSWPELHTMIGLKMCAEYQLTNMTGDSNAPYLVLNGLTYFKTSLLKADPTAKNYVLEYKWNKTQELSIFKLMFDTPGSQVNREISATVAFDILNNNVTVLLHSAGNSLIAKGTYKHSEDETFIDIGFDVNGTKHLDASLGYTRVKFNHGYTYHPKVHLTINSERVAAISGAIRHAQKNNVSQFDIDLTFQTKRVWSKLVGYVVKRNISLAGDFQLEYQLQHMPKKESLHLEILLSNPSSKTLTHKTADLKLHSTAYPQLNTAINAWYQQALGHLELHAEVNSNPHLKDDRHKLTAQLIISYSNMYFQNQGTKVSALIAVTKPIQNLDIKVGVNHYSLVAESKTSLLIGYAPGKEISLIVNLIMPRGLLFSMEGHTNLTIPNFNSMLVDVRIMERLQNEYELEFSGTWFSDHNMTARGTYSDRSSVVVVNHHLKMIFKSPSFVTPILLNCHLYQNHSDIKVSLCAEQVDYNKYAFVLNHTVLSATSLISYVEAKYRGTVYSLLTNMDTTREIRLELHLDNWRDVHLTLSGTNEEDRQEFAAEVKWDANRDPALKLGTMLQLSKVYILDAASPGIKQNAIITLTYPGRSVVGSCDLVVRSPHNYQVDINLNWNPEDAIKVSIGADYNVQPEMISVKLESQLLTPFEQWKKTALNAKYLQLSDKVSASTSVHWKDSQHVMGELFANTNEQQDLKEWTANCGLISTVHAITWITVNVTHKVLRSQIMDTHVLVKYDPDKTIDAHSAWQLDKESDNVFNLTGNLHLYSPLANYRKNKFKCQLCLMSSWKFFGAANLDLDKRKYTGHLIGDLARWKESKIEFNATTPLEKFAFVRGRFGLSERNRHTVAEIVTPNGPLGVEAMCQILTVTHDFNIKLMLATPIEMLQKALVTAKLNRREADFRIGYNNITAGFLGTWHYHNITDFDYSYIVFTPLKGLEECGIITKLIVVRTEPGGMLDVDTEFSLRLSNIKLGIRAKGGPKLPPIKIPIKMGIITPTTNNPEVDELEEVEEEEEDDENNLYWRGELQIWPAIMLDMIGELDIDTEGDTYKILSTISLPLGKIIIDDSFTMEDVFHINNDLHVDLTFSNIREITSSYAFLIDMENPTYFMEMNVNVKKDNTWIETGFHGNYSIKNDDTVAHMIKFNIKTPIEPLNNVRINTIIKIKDKFYNGSVTIHGDQSVIDLSGEIKLKNALLDMMVSGAIDTPIIKIPKTTIVIKKDFTESKKQFKFSAGMEEPISKYTSLESAWQIDEHLVRASAKLESWIKALESLETDILYSNAIHVNNTAKLNAHLTHLGKEYQLNGNLNNDKIDADLDTPFSESHYQFHGNLKVIDETIGAIYYVDGKLKDQLQNKYYDVNSVILTQKNIPISMNVSLFPTGKPNTNRINLELKRKKYGLLLDVNNESFNSSVDVNILNNLNWDMKARTDIQTANTIDTYQLITFMNVQVNGNATLYIHAETPWNDSRIVTMNGNMMLTNQSGDVRLNNQFNDNRCHAVMSWSLLYMENMFVKFMTGYDTADLGKKEVNTHIFFMNPGRVYRALNMGFDLDIDRKAWELEANATIGFRNQQNVDAVFVVKLPPPNNDDHRFLISYHTNQNVSDISYVVGYNAVRAKKNYASDGSIRIATRDINGHLRLTWGLLPSQSVNNLFNITFDKKEIELKYSLYTPKILQEETLVLLFSYDANSDKQNLINVDLFYPPSRQIGSARIFYESLINVNGSLNASTSIENLSYIGCNFIVLTALRQNKKFIELFWPNNTALLDSNYNYYSERLDSNMDGVLHVEVPLNARHIGHLTYGYKKRPQHTTGHSILLYNDQKVLHARYNSTSESRAGFEKDNIEVTVENIYKPIGVVYTNQYEYSGGNEGTNYPTIEFKHVNVYRLDNSSAFNIAAESRIRTTHTGQNIQLKAMHSNRTIQLKTDYQILPGEFDQNAWLGVSEDAWISYHVNILNKTTEDIDNQFLILGLNYPGRNFTLDGSYKITSDEVNSEANLQWQRNDEKSRTVGASFNWTNLTATQNQQQAVLIFRHPTFVKNVTFKGVLTKRDSRDLINVAFAADYSTDENKLLTLSALLRDESDASRIKYLYRIVGKHINTKMDLDVEGFVHKRESVLLETVNHARYQRGYMPSEVGELIGRIDRESRMIIFRRVNNEAIKYFEIGYYPSSSRYVVNGTAINMPENLNATGAFFLDSSEKLTWMMVNYTPDATVSLRMHGIIPDARNARLNVWRTYDNDLTISDVSFYLKLNHSRLVTSTLRWRPELKSDIISTVKTSFNEMYKNMDNDIIYWKQYIKNEVINAITDVWEDAQEDISGFLDDWNDLKVLECDFEELKIYLNNSYNANDFYIKDVVSFGMYVIDELSLRSHIQSLPNILNEIWEIMGESGEALRNSLLWLIETVKNAYNKVSEIIAAVFRGDSVSQVANIIEKLIEKYDMFIKDLHVSLIKYVENLWNTIFLSIAEQWYYFLKLMEPLFIQFVHYVETLVWKASKEILDFLYDRKKEFITSPYFDRFTNFTQDIDKVYRDIKANDIITNVHKYSSLIIHFLKVRYFAFVPFGKEFKDIVDEIVSELKELKKLPSINYTLEKLELVYDRISYFCEYFEVKAKIEAVIRLVHSKIMDISQTALQAENRYREAKTMFIFDPNQGLMCLEQKLPMSWHAFNQTPEFHEIPEIRAVMNVRTYFTTSNTTFWTLYYQYKPYSELSNWLPPFKAQAMIIGSQHYITFDGRYFDFAGNCTYLLAKDFVRNTFALLVKYDRQAEKITHQIIVLIGRNAIELDLFNDTIKLISQQSGRTMTNLQLPIELDNDMTYIYQVENVVTVERKHNQFRLECNLKFNLCSLELSGWYYGKVAGLLGTMNNERFDDNLGSNKLLLKDTGSFARSWSINEDCTDATNYVSGTQHQDSVISTFCNELFVNKSSEFGICFNVIEPAEYADMCLSASTEAEACTVAMSYMQKCMFRDTYLRIPDRCTTCTMIDGSQIAEGNIKRLESNKVPRSADVVFIVEAKNCNRDLKLNNSMELLITQLNKELDNRNLTGNRWSLVVFGGDGVYDNPRSIILDRQIFTKNAARFVDYFDYVSIGSGSQDIFAAIGFASRLVFRAGVSKTFILMPCSHCESENQMLEYSVLHQVMLEHDITLHILMDGDFEYEKEKISKIFYGLDAAKSYTKKDARVLHGDVDLRRQVKLSKNVLGYCTPLSLETNGTIFSGTKLRLEKNASIKKFASVFSKRVALTAEPNQCQVCECIADNNGVTKMECTPCIYPMPVHVNYMSETFNLNESLSMIPPLDDDYGQIDMEND